YLGWVAAQVTALGLVFNVLSDGAISKPIGMLIGTGSILAYTLFGGMWSVAVTDFIQMIILVLGLAVIAVFAGNQAGGADKVDALLKTGVKADSQMILPTLVKDHMPFLMQVLFFGALLSAIKSTASATLLAPSVTFVENIWRQFYRRESDKSELRTMRITVLIFSACVCAYAISLQGTPIYEQVSGAYQ